MPSLVILVLAFFGVPANFQPSAEDAQSLERVRRIILHSRHLGAHGMGYNRQSLNTLSEELKLADVPTLIGLLTDEDLRVGVQFALASQCDAAIIPVREAAVQYKMWFLEAEDVMHMMEDFAVCTPAAQQRA